MPVLDESPGLRYSTRTWQTKPRGSSDEIGGEADYQGGDIASHRPQKRGINDCCPWRVVSRLYPVQPKSDGYVVVIGKGPKSDGLYGGVIRAEIAQPILSSEYTARCAGTGEDVRSPDEACLMAYCPPDRCRSLNGLYAMQKSRAGGLPQGHLEFFPAHISQ